MLDGDRLHGIGEILLGQGSSFSFEWSAWRRMFRKQEFIIARRHQKRIGDWNRSKVL